MTIQIYNNQIEKDLKYSFQSYLKHLGYSVATCNNGDHIREPNINASFNCRKSYAQCCIVLKLNMFALKTCSCWVVYHAYHGAQLQRSALYTYKVASNWSGLVSITCCPSKDNSQITLQLISVWQKKKYRYKFILVSSILLSI